VTSLTGIVNSAGVQPRIFFGSLSSPPSTKDFITEGATSLLGWSFNQSELLLLNALFHWTTSQLIVVSWLKAEL
jgi:hypothetical protein